MPLSTLNITQGLTYNLAKRLDTSLLTTNTLLCGDIITAVNKSHVL